MSQPLDYARRLPVDPEIAAFRRTRIIYMVGVTLAWITFAAFQLNWPHTTNSIDYRKAQIFMAEHVIGWAALAWNVLGLRRVFLSPLLRHDKFTWAAIVANFMLVLFTLSWTAYQ